MDFIYEDISEACRQGDIIEVKRIINELNQYVNFDVNTTVNLNYLFIFFKLNIEDSTIFFQLNY